jgi:hypothetical protein
MADDEEIEPTVKLKGESPRDPANGWLTIIGELRTADGAALRRRAVIEYYVADRNVDTDSGEIVPRVRITQVEVCEDPALAARATELMDDAQAGRLGQGIMPAHP